MALQHVTNFGVFTAMGNPEIILSIYSPGESEENQERYKPGQPVTRPNF
jgi:hypothetical protein